MNNSDSLLQQVTHDLPNFPRNIIDVWIYPYAKTLGWPPDINAENNRWKYILLQMGIEYWKKIIWLSETVSIDDLSFSSETKRTVRSVSWMLYGGDSKQRVDRIVSFLQAHGTFPQPPVFIKSDGELTIVDGNHRLFAYLACARSISKHNIDNYLNKIHTIWIGTPT